MFVGESGVSRVIQRTCQVMRELGTDDPERVRAAGAIDLPTIQRYINFHFSVTIDLFGADESSNAATFYSTGLKGRFGEGKRNDDHVLKDDSYRVLVERDGNLSEKEVPMLNAALDMVLEWGPERVQEYCEDLVEPFEEVFREAGFELEDRAWRGAHLFGLRSVRGLDAEKAAATLRRAGVFVSVRGDAIRVAPQVYNDRADLDALAATLRSL